MRRAFQFASRMFAGSVMLAFLTVAHASVLDKDPFFYDPGFNGGITLEDRFAAISNNASQGASKLAWLSNGDLLVAGTIPAAFQNNQPDLRWNLGLVRYGPDGARVAWSNPTPAYVYFENRYIDFPNSTSAHFSLVRSVKVIAGYIYVMVDYVVDAQNTDVQIIAFREDGSFIGAYDAFNTSLYENGAGLVAYSVPNCNGILPCHKLIAVAFYKNGSDRYVVTTKRFSVGDSGPPTFTPNGTLAVDSVFGPYGNGANDFVAPDSACEAHQNCSLIPVDVAATRTDSFDPTVYIGGRFANYPGPEGAENRTFVMSISGASGSQYADFGGTGYVTPTFDVAINLVDSASKLIAVPGMFRVTDVIYVVSTVVLCNAYATGVTKLYGSGSQDHEFGNDLLLFGGDLTLNCSSPPGASQLAPAGAALDGTRLAIVGFENMAVVRTTDGTLADLRSLSALRYDGTPWPYTRWADVIAAGTGRFIATGAMYDGGVIPYQFATSRFRPDRIFGGEFEAP